MADRTALRKPSAAPERRGAPAAAPRHAASAASAASALRDRMGGRAAGQVARAGAAGRAAASGGAPRVEIPAPRAPQLAGAGLKVSRPTDAAELEAEATARAVARMPDPPAPVPIAGRAEGGEVQRAAAPSPRASAAGPGPAGGGAPLPAPVRAAMEPRFGASFANVRIHTGEAAARQSEALGAAAFTIGDHIHFGRGRFQPETASGRELLAHELTHTIQQGAAAQGTVARRSPEVTVSARAPATLQRSWLDDLDPREWLAGKAALLPGFTLLTVALGVNPITGAGVDRSAGNMLRAAIELMPGGALITRALDAHGLFDRVSVWAAAQLAALTALGSSLWQAVKDVLDSLSWGDLLSPGEAWDRAKAMLGRPIERARALVVGLVDGIVELVRQAVLLPLAAAARGTHAYPLLCAVLGKDPITGEAAAQDAGSLLGAFMTFIGQGELWANLQKANAVPRAFAWFRGAVAALRAFVAGIPDLFVQAFRALGLEDLLDVAGAFRKVAGVFGGFVGRFVSWGLESTWKLLEILFDVVSPGAFRYVKQAGAALRRVLQDPIGFVGNLVRAARLGFEGFAARFLGHLRTGLLEWLTGALPGVYVPKAFSLVEIARFVFSVLEIGWSFIRPKLVRAVGEPAVKALETGFDLVVRVVREGPVAVWQELQGQLASLRDTVLGGITSFVVETVVKRAIPKLVSLFIPGAGFISAIVSIYDVVMVVVQKLARIGEVVRGFVGSIAGIAGGAVAAAARRIETTIAGVLSLAISFFAGFVGLGKVADKIRAVIERVRGAIGKAIDWLVARIVAAARKLGALVAAGGRAVWGWLGGHRRFSADGEAHETWIDDQGEPQVASQAMPLGTRITRWKRRAERLPDDQKRTALQRIDRTAALNVALRDAAKRALKARQASNTTAIDAAHREIDRIQADLLPELAALLVLFRDDQTAAGAQADARIFAVVELYDRVVVPLVKKGLVRGNPETISKQFQAFWNRSKPAIAQAKGLAVQMELVLVAARNVGTGRVPYLVAVELSIPGTRVDYVVREREAKTKHIDISVEVKNWGAMRDRQTSKGVLTVAQQIGTRIAGLTKQVRSALDDDQFSGAAVEIRGYANMPQEMRDALADALAAFAAYAGQKKKTFRWGEV